MKIAKVALLLIFSMFFSVVSAGAIKPYSQAEFDRLSAARKPVVLAIHATWCPTCKAQKPILSALMNLPAYQDVTLLMIDFDTDKPLVQKYKVPMQSTLIGFRGGREVARSVGDTTHAGIEGLVKKTVI